MTASTKRPPFAIIPGDAIFDPDLKPLDVRVLNALCRFANRFGYCIRSQVKLALELQISRTSVQNAIYRLVEAGWLLITRGERPDGGKCANTYRILREKGNGKEQAKEQERLDVEPPAPKRQGANYNWHGMPSTVGKHKNKIYKTTLSDENPADATGQDPSGIEGEQGAGASSPNTGNAGPDVISDKERRYIADAVSALSSIGLDPSGGGLHGGVGPIQTWCREGCDLQNDVLPAIRRVLRKAKCRPHSLKYFSRAIFAARRSRLTNVADTERDFLFVASPAYEERRAVQERVLASIDRD